MAKILEIGVKFDTSGAVKSMADLDKQSKKTFDSIAKNADKAGKSTKKTFSEGKKEAKGFGDELQNVTQYSGRFGGAISKVTSGLKSMNPLLLAGAVAVGVLIGGVTAGVKEFATFEKTMSNVKALVRPTTIEFGRLSEQARELGATTAFTADQAGKAFTELGKLGFDTNQIIASSADVLNLAAAANTDMATAALATAKTLNQFNLEAGEAGRVTDIIALASASSAIDIYSFSESMKIAGATSKGFGVSIEESTAVISAMANAGLEGTMAGTGFSRMLVEMGRNGSKSNKLIKSLGLENATLTNKLLGLQKAGLSAGQTIETFGLLAGKSALAVINNADEIKRLGEEYKDAGGAAQKMADTQLDNLDGSIKLLKSGFSELKLEIGEVFAPSVRGTVDLLTDALMVLNSTLDSKDRSQSILQLKVRSAEVDKQRLLVNELAKANMKNGQAIRRSWMTEGDWRRAQESADATALSNKNKLAKADERLIELTKLLRAEAGITPKGKGRTGEKSAAEIEEEARKKRAAAQEVLDQEETKRKLEAFNRARITTLDRWNLYQINATEDTLNKKLALIEFNKEKELRLLGEDVTAGKITTEKSEVIKKSIETTAETKTEKAKSDESESLAKDLEKQKALLLQFAGFKVSLIQDGIDKDIAAVDAKYAAELEKLKQFKEDGLATEDEFGAMKLELQEAQKQEESELEDAYLEQRLEKYNQHFQMVGGLAQDLLKGSFAFANSTDEARLKKMRNANKKELKNKSLTDSQKQKLSEKFDAEEEALERKIFERKKKQSIANALISGALAIGSVWAEWAAAPPVAIAMSAVAGTMTGLNVAAIASQEFADGGVVMQERGVPSTGDNHIIRVNPGEEVLTANDPRHRNNGGGQPVQVNYTSGDIIIQSDSVSDNDIEKIRQTQDDDLFKFRDMYQTLKNAGEIE